ncbi:MAG TPA: ABC transporter ATP-binding protein [Caulobacteraceae bacterium]|nr:ABC transporter ATP-binding protein [Caulobacteraceae bacterium]
MRAITWRHAWGIIAARPWPFFASLSGYVVFFCLQLAPGLITRRIFDGLSGQAPAGFNVWTLIALMLALELGRVGTLYVAGVIFNVVSYSGEALLKGNMLRWLVTAPGPRRLPGSTGEAVSRFRDDPLETVGLTTILIVSPQIVTGLVGFAIMLAINATIALVVVPPVVATVVVTYLLTRNIQRYRKAAREATARVTGYIGEVFGAVQALKLAGAEGRVVGRLAELNEQRRAASIRDLMFSTGLGSFGANLAALGSGCVLLLAAQAMRAGAFTVGDFTLFASYLALASAIPAMVGQILAVERQSRVSIDRMRALADGAPPLALVARPPKVAPAPAATRADGLEVLSVRGLTRRHPGSERGIEGVDLTLRRGGFTVVTGPVGAGKTTLVRALIGLIPRDAGEIAWNGAPVADPASFLVPPRCAYTAQQPRLFSETLRQNVLMGADAAGLDHAIELAVFEDDVAGFEQGLETRVGTRGVTLSGGQLQRAAATRMFVRGTDLVIFDDLSSALDVATEQQLWRRLFAQDRSTCLAISHRREALRRADEILVLDEGRVVARGDAAALLVGCALFQRIWGEDQ